MIGSLMVRSHPVAGGGVQREHGEAAKTERHKQKIEHQEAPRKTATRSDRAGPQISFR
jgi:hypothetical protein